MREATINGAGRGRPSTAAGKGGGVGGCYGRWGRGERGLVVDGFRELRFPEP